MGRALMSLDVRLVPPVMHIQVRGQRHHDPRFQDHRFAGHIVAFPMNLQQMMPLVEVQVPPLGPGEFDAAQTHGTPEDGHRVVAEGQFILFPRGAASGHRLQELSDLVFAQTVPDKALRDPEAADLVHRVPGEFALVDHPATEATQRGEVEIHGARFHGVDQIGVISAEYWDGQRFGLAITAPPFEESPERLAVGHDGRGCPIAGQKALHDRADVVVGSWRADWRVVWPPQEGNVVVFDAPGGPLQGPGLGRLLDREDRQNRE